MWSECFFYSGQSVEVTWGQVVVMRWGSAQGFMTEQEHKAETNSWRPQLLPAGFVNTSLPMHRSPSPCCLSPRPDEDGEPDSLAPKGVWRCTGKICISSRWAAEAPPEKPGIHRDKPITSSELIIVRHQHNTNISPDTDTSLPLTVFSPQSFLNLTNWHKIWLLFVSNWAGALVLVDITAYLPQIHVMLCFLCQV